MKSEVHTWGSTKTYFMAQSARTFDGNYVVFTWNDTPVDPDSLNKAPDLYTYIINGVDTSKHIGPLNLTTGTAAEALIFHCQASPIVKISNDIITIPLVVPYVDLENGNPDNQTEFLYISGLEVNINSIVDVKENIKNKLDLLVYPNPVAEKVFVASNAKVELYDVNGKLVYVDNSDNHKTIDMNSYPCGVYVVKVYTESGVKTQKIVKN